LFKSHAIRRPLIFLLKWYIDTTTIYQTNNELLLYNIMKQMKSQGSRCYVHK